MGKILYMRNKMSGNGMKTAVYTGKGSFDIHPSTLNRFRTMGQGIFGNATHEVVPFFGGNGMHQKDKNISGRVKKIL